MASFEDMRRALARFGFLAAGFAASYDQLTKLKMPVIVYLKHRKAEHFSVLRGIDDKTVWLADPSLGNRTYSRWQFLDMWDTQADNTNLKGRVLGVLPMGTSPGLSDFFTTAPSVKLPWRWNASRHSLIGSRLRCIRSIYGDRDLGHRAQAGHLRDRRRNYPAKGYRGIEWIAGVP